MISSRQPSRERCVRETRLAITLLCKAGGMKYTDFICFDATIHPLETDDRDQVIRSLVQSLDKAGKLPEGQCEDILQAVISRENEASTGMGKGVAVPHVKHASVNEVIGAVGISEKGC